MGKKIGKSKSFKKIVIATFIAIFSLMSAFTGTIAWFSSMSSVSVTGATFKVQTPTGIGYELYYLEGFDTDDNGSIDKSGNYNSVVDEHVGYESASTGAVFTLVEESYEEDEKNPTDISHLWPAHRLTYAMVLSSEFSTFSLSSWSEVKGITAKIYDEQNPETIVSETDVSITWAINIYSAAYIVGSTSNDVLDDISTGFAEFVADELDENNDVVVDKFDFNQGNEATSSVALADSNSVFDEGGDRTILYFSIEFSNDSSTFYKLGGTKNSPFYYKDTSGNSNCYKGLTFNSLVFNLA